jgi:hypothetical protein
MKIALFLVVLGVAYATTALEAHEKQVACNKACEKNPREMLQCMQECKRQFYQLIQTNHAAAPEKSGVRVKVIKQESYLRSVLPMIKGRHATQLLRRMKELHVV